MSAVIIAALVIFFSAVSGAWPPEANARSEYTPPGLYDVEQVRLANGFRILMKQRTQTHNVSFRLVVGLGSRHFDCNHRETAHLIEHLLFSGTSRHSETGLERLIQESGGSWNAATGTRSTVYQIDIFDEYEDVAVDTLHEIITDTSFTPEKIRKAKDIAIREDGGKPSALRRALYRYNIGKSAWTKANEWLLPGEGAVCNGLIDVDPISDNSIAEAFRAAYVPGNMTLIVVGNFDGTSLIAGIRRTFGRMTPAPRPKLVVTTPPEPGNGPALAKGILAPFLGTNGYVGVAYRTEGRDSPDAPALSVLSAYLNESIYEQLRVNNGLSYGPEVSSFLRPDYGVLYVSADAAIKNVDLVGKLIHESLERIIKRPITPQETERTKKRILLQWVQGYETNSGIAHFYTENLRELERFGAFRDHAGDIEKVTADDVNRVAVKYLNQDRRIDISGVPTLTYSQLYTAMGITFSLAVAAVLVLIRKKISTR